MIIGDYEGSRRLLADLFDSFFPRLELIRCIEEAVAVLALLCGKPLPVIAAMQTYIAGRTGDVCADPMVVVHERFVRVEGKIQNQDGIIHVKAERITPLNISSAGPDSHDFY